MSMLYMMGAVSGALAFAGFGKQPYNFQEEFPFQVIVISNKTAVNGSDYSLQLTMNNLNSTDLDHLTASVTKFNPTLTQALSVAFKGLAYMNVAGAEPSLLLEPEPLIFSAAYDGYRAGGMMSTIVMIMAVGGVLVTIVWA